jgi:hypothetical protein
MGYRHPQLGCCDSPQSPAVGVCADSSRHVLLSFDAEEFDIPNEYGRPVSVDIQMAIGAEGLSRVLDVLDQTDVRATFFTTARLAEAAPHLIRRLIDAGHELASHGVSHSSWSDSDMRESREILETIGHVPVRGFRRARFQAVSAEAVRAGGYDYDSSEHPVWIPGRYNGWASSRHPRMDQGLVRVPVSSSPVVRVPLFWLAFKNYPARLYRAICRWTLRTDGILVLFFHPWEFCELGGFGLPSYISRPDGVALQRRLAALIAELKSLAEFVTYGEWTKSAFPCRQPRQRMQQS